MSGVSGETMSQVIRTILMGGLCIVGTALGQVPSSPDPAAAGAGKPMIYDVVSVKLNKSDSGNMMWNSTATGVKMDNVNLRMLIAAAYALRAPVDEQITGLPKWAEDEHFDVEAKVSAEDADAFKKLKEPERAALLLAALEERFKMKAHRETRELPIYSLVVGRGGSKLKEDPNGIGHVKMSMDGSVFHAEFSSMPMEWVASNLSYQVSRQVRDDTGLKGKYTMKLEWAPAEAKDTALPGIFTAVQDQWGLKLVPAKGPVECVVVDHVEQPSEN